MTAAPVTTDVVSRFVAGETAGRGHRRHPPLVGDGRLVTIDHLGEDTTERRQADAVVAAYLTSAGPAGRRRLDRRRPRCR